ncbi:glycosyltransferase [Candidatus Poriferisocius sp.]|uniref:rhamnosyltransferase WsaF family glycosyltransferase n=1 Tax=Candidatus Poriferisocius sp. TaxID=3101276 RepID=UPI003B02E508
MVRRLLERALPRDTRRRRLVSGAMVIVREARGAARRTLAEWQRRRLEINPPSELLDEAVEPAGAESMDEAGPDPTVESQLEVEPDPEPEPPRQPAGVTYRNWWCRLPADPSVLELQRQWFNEWPRPLKVWAAVVDDGGDVTATELTLRNQSWGLVEVVVVEPGGLADVFDRLSRDCPKDLVLLLRAGDRLRPDAVFQIAQAAWRDPWLELVYWDDDRSDLAEVWDWYLDGMPEGIYFDDELERSSQPRLKPEWSPDLLVCANYIGRAFAVRARRLRSEVALRHRDAGDDDTLWWDLLLGLDVVDQQVSRLPAVLQSLDSTDDRIGSRHLELVDQWLKRQDWPARAEPGNRGINLAWMPNPTVPVTVIIATRHNRELLEGAFDLIRSACHSALELVIVDNGGRSDDNEAWYRAQAADLSPQVIWWDKPFNYSAVNNYAASQATGEVLVFLNDDTSPGHPGWLHNLIGWAQRPEIGVVGLQLIDDDGLIQHGGVIVGLNGFADHLFQGMAPHSDSLLGPTDWTRNAVAATGACLAVRRSVFDEVGGFEERLELCGSDVVLGLRTRQAGYRNVVSAATPVGHRESATRGRFVPETDVFTSYWFYQQWLIGGDPYFSPNLSVFHSEPVLCCEERPGIFKHLTKLLGRPMEVFYQRNESSDAHALATVCIADRSLTEKVSRGHRAVQGRREVRSVNWFVPEFQHPFYGGIHTVFRLADHLATNHGIENRFMVVTGSEPHDVRWYRSGIAAAFESLSDCPIVYHDFATFDPDDIPPADAALATMWTTAYFVARATAQRRRFYLIQDYEPMFHPAGTLSALAEHSYRIGLYGLCNTGRLADIYRDRYGGIAQHFWPAVDESIFHARGRDEPDPDRPTTVFIYSRPSHMRNCWELAARAVRLVKDQLADDVRVVTAGSWAFPEHMDSLVTHLGQLDYRATGQLYRTCDIGVALTTSEHPSYLPLELMACGAAVVAFENPAGDWLLRHDHNSMLSTQTADGLADEIVTLVLDRERRQRLAKQGLADIAARHARWGENLAGLFDYLCNPEPQDARTPR